VPAAIEADIARSVDAIAAVTSTKPRGFRAPGYNVSEPVFDALEKLGFAYDSSVLPSSLYWGARAAHIAMQWARRAPSTSIVGRRRDFSSTPKRAYRPKRGKAWQAAKSRVEGRDLVELPIASLAGVPFFGTALAFAPSAIAAATSAAALTASSPCVLELHAIDLCDDGDGFDRALVAARRDLRVPVSAKLARLGSALRVLAQAADVETLLSASERADLSF
jgi:peptidoglycan-N-acetylglucosamine deacetylase